MGWCSSPRRRGRGSSTGCRRSRVGTTASGTRSELAKRVALAKIPRMSRKTLVLRIALAALATTVLATCGAPTPKFAIKYAEKRGTITKNGLRFVIVPDATTQMVEVDVRYDVGSREDPEGKAGIAHLVEHLMFQQRPDGPTTPPLMHFLDQLTVGFNAFTNWDTTHYMTSSRADMTDALLKIEAMRMFFGCQTIANEEFE